MNDDGKDDGEEIICEFFGIKIKTKNPNVARVLTSDVNEILNVDVRQIKSVLASPGKETADLSGSDAASNSDTASLSENGEDREEKESEAQDTEARLPELR